MAYGRGDSVCTIKMKDDWWVQREPSNYFDAIAWTAVGPLYRADDKEESLVTISRVLIICSLIVFVVAAIGVSAPINLVALGLAFFAAGHVV